MQYLLVGLGGFCGAAARFGVGRLMAGIGPGLPLATLTVNVAGSFLIGFLAVFLAYKNFGGDELRLLALVGFLGAFTTFSTFSLDTLTLLNNGDWQRAGLNVLGNVLLCLLAVAGGSFLARYILH